MDYFAPTTLREAEALKKKAGRGGVYLAGGTILNWKKSPKADCLIDLKNLGLDRIAISGSKISLGATTTIQDAADHEKLPSALVQSARNFSSRNIRNMATVGGTVAGRFFVSDVLPVLLSFRAKTEFFSEGRKKTLLLEEWLKSRPGLVCALVIDRPRRLVEVRQEKISGIDFPMIVTAVGFELVDHRMEAPVVAISGASAKTQVVRSAASYLEGCSVRSVAHAELNRLVQREIDVSDNVKAPVAVKRRFIEGHIKSITAECKRAVR